MELARHMLSAQRQDHGCQVTLHRDLRLPSSSLMKPLILKLIARSCLWMESFCVPAHTRGQAGRPPTLWTMCGVSLPWTPLRIPALTPPAPSQSCAGSLQRTLIPGVPR